MFCGSCGREIVGSAKFCPYCGATIKPAFTDETKVTVEENPTFSPVDETSFTNEEESVSENTPENAFVKAEEGSDEAAETETEKIQTAETETEQTENVQPVNEWVNETQNNGQQYNNAQYNNVQNNGQQYNNAQYNNVQNNGQQYNNAQNNGQQYNNAQYNNPQYNQYNNGQYNGNGVTPYSLADMPEQKKKKRKRPLWLSFICTTISVILSICLFCMCMGQLVFISMFKSGTPLKSKNAELSKLNVGFIVNSLDTSKEYDDDITLSEFIYQQIPKSDRNNISEKDIAEMIDDPGIRDFMDDILNGYVEVLTGEEKETSFTNDDIITLIGDEEELIEEVLGRDLKSSDYKSIEKFLDDINFEENANIASHYDQETRETLKPLADFIQNSDSMILGCWIMIGVLMLLILLLNLHKPTAVLNYGGVCAVISGGLAVALSQTMEMVIKSMDKRAKAMIDLALGVFGNPQDKFMTYGMIFLGVGLGMIVVCAIIRVIRRAVVR